MGGWDTTQLDEASKKVILDLTLDPKIVPQQCVKKKKSACFIPQPAENNVFFCILNNYDKIFVTWKVWLLKICEEYVDKYLGFDNVTALISQVEAVQPKKKEDRFICRATGCQAKYVYHSGRVRY